MCIRKFVVSRKIKVEGEKIGIEKGKAEGEKIGEARGIEKERAKAWEEKNESAKKMLAAGLSIEQVSQYLNIPEEYLRELAR